MKDRVLEVILEAVHQLGDELDSDALRQADADTPLYGSSGTLDSIGLVTLVAEAEDRLAQAFGTDIVLADERAMSHTRSPFRTAGSMARYAATLLEETGAKP